MLSCKLKHKTMGPAEPRQQSPKAAPPAIDITQITGRTSDENEAWLQLTNQIFARFQVAVDEVNVRNICHLARALASHADTRVDLELIKGKVARILLLSSSGLSTIPEIEIAGALVRVIFNDRARDFDL